MIISCPNCSARYRIAATNLAENTRMRCAKCEHRWVPEAEAVAEIPVPVVEAPPEPPVLEEPAHEAAETGGSTVLRTLAAIIIGGALAIAAGAIWVARVDPQTIPLLGDNIAALTPGPLPLAVAFTAKTTSLPSGDHLLEIKGTLRNTGTSTVTLPDLEARLSSPGTTVRRWRIAAPVTELKPGTGVAFTSTATGFPAEATIVAIRPAR